MSRTEKQRAFALLEILIATALVILLAYYAVKVYYKNSALDKPTEKALKEQGINAEADNYSDMIKDSQKKVDEFNKSTENHQKQAIQNK
ncbi:MAG: hypothetical protein A2539_08170 [Elusimicrobia bacterium RIFOXYD2_FULL_34_15]|nr:MAG: hypothetical protein A2539_08170 [Elusimicrobia bacterium RIFOXYD2_FULL_34_15]